MVARGVAMEGSRGVAKGAFNCFCPNLVKSAADSTVCLIGEGSKMSVASARSWVASLDAFGTFSRLKIDASIVLSIGVEFRIGEGKRNFLLEPMFVVGDLNEEEVIKGDITRGEVT